MDICDAADSGNIDVIKALLADMDIRDKYKSIPLHIASRENHIEIVKILLDAGMDINSIDSMGDTPLHHAAYNGKIDVVKNTS